ncbi:MAG TPA: DUF4956 domain-containing protein [Acidimicrobiales bacterium]
MSPSAIFALDLLAIAVLTFGLYFPRHRRRDLVVSYLGVNIGVLAVTKALTSADITAGLGVGLLGVLSIIRLRSFELDQQEVAYYFVALALGVLGGVRISPEWLAPALMVAMLVAIAIGDHPALFARYRVQTLVLDAAYTDEGALVRRLQHTLGATVHRVAVRRVDLLNDSTIVEVRYSLPAPDSTPPGDGSHELLPGDLVGS